MQETGVPTQKSEIPKTTKEESSGMNLCGSPIVVSLDWFLRMEGFALIEKNSCSCDKVGIN